MKNLIFAFALMVSPVVWAGGDLPFPLDQVQLMSSPEIWQDPAKEFKVFCQLGKAQGHDVLIVRIMSVDGMLLDQKATLLTEGSAKLVFEWNHITLRFVRKASGEFASLQIDGQSWRSLVKVSEVLF